MDKLIDIIGAAVLWSLFILIMLRINASINDNSLENLNTAITQMDAIELGKIIEFDFPRVGNMISGDKIANADSNEFEFYFDDNLDGSIDSLKYFVGADTDLSHTSNPDDKYVYRSFNNTTNVIGRISNFKLSYFDSSGTQLSYASLSSQTIRNNIKTIQIYILNESVFNNNDGHYPAAEWERKISPKNL